MAWDIEFFVEAPDLCLNIADESVLVDNCVIFLRSILIPVNFTVIAKVCNSFRDIFEPAAPLVGIVLYLDGSFLFLVHFIVKNKSLLFIITDLDEFVAYFQNQLLLLVNESNFFNLIFRWYKCHFTSLLHKIAPAVSKFSLLFSFLFLIILLKLN